MKKLTLLSVFAFIALCVSAFAQPKIVIQGGDSFDWGNVKAEQSPIKMDLKITNAGNKMLKLKSVRPGCGCTVAQMTKDSLEPNETTVIPVSLNLGSYDGPVSKGITIESNDTAKPVIYFTLKANVVRPVSTRPTYMPFNNAMVGKEDKGTMIIHNNTAKDITITGITLSSQDLKISLKKGDILPPNKDVNVEGIIKMDKAGYFNVKIDLTTDNLEVPTLTFYAYGQVLDVPSHPAEAPAAKELNIQSPGNDIKIQAAPATDVKAQTAPANTNENTPEKKSNKKKK